FLDDMALATNPFEHRLAIDDRIHSLRAEATGYAPRTSAVTLDKDLHLVLALEKVHAVREAAPKASAKPVQTAEATNGSCVPPYYFDENGIKKYRPECL